MVDIDPMPSLSKFVPRDPTLVDAVAETKRIADQQMRSNPLKDANIDSGLTQWLGNYSEDFAAFGEFYPADPNLVDAYGNLRPQRGTSLTRDDPQGNPWLQCYDFDPQPGQPLRQKIVSFDADRRIMFKEGQAGGWAFPDRMIPMYQSFAYMDSTGLTEGSATVAFQGEGHITGHRIHFQGAWSTTGSPTVNSFVRVTGVDGTVINSTTLTAAGPSVVTHVVDLLGSLWNNENYARVDWFLWRTGTGAYFPRPRLCRNYSLT